MFNSRRSLVVSTFTALGLLVPLSSAAAHDDHPATYEPSPTGSTSNVKLLASVPKVSEDPFYRNSDLAFWGKIMYAGNYEGFRVLDISEPENPVLLSEVPCPGAQHDVGVWKNLLFLSIDAPLTGPACGSPRAPSGAPGWEGIRIFDVSDPRNPVYRGAVATDCGSHTHTVVPDADNPSRVFLYVSSYPASGLGYSPYGNSCFRIAPDGSQGHSKISVVEIPLAAPETASVVSEPMFPLNDYTLSGFRGCHDISVFLETKRAAAACMSEGQIWDISNPQHPVTLARIHNPAVDFFHSATFTWDATTVLFGDEAGGGTRPRCRASDPTTLGAIWLYDVASLDVLDGSSLEAPLSSFKIPRIQGEVARCTMHNFNVLPVNGRYIGVSSAYSGGTSVFDFTDRTSPVEIGYNDPHGANTWSSYWYNGFIYTNDTGRGIDVMLLADAARSGAKKLPYLNPQTQESRLR